LEKEEKRQKTLKIIGQLKLLAKRKLFSNIFLVLIVVSWPSILGSKRVCLDQA
jgi:hypothetical protein